MLLKDAIDLIFVQRAGLRGKAQTAKGYETDTRQFCVYLNNPTIMNVRLDDVERYLTQMAVAGFSQNGIIHKACAIRVLFKNLRRHGHIVLNPSDIPIPRREFKEVRVADDEQIAKVLDLIPFGSKDVREARNRTMLLMLRDTGMRVSEMCSLDLDHIDLEAKRATIKTAKSRGIRPMRVVCWYDDCNAALEHWLKLRKQLEKKLKRFTDPDALFVACYGWRTGFRLTNSAIEIAFRKLSRAAFVEVLNPHSLRHRKGHMLAKSGANNSVISGVLGHSSLASSYVYTMLNNQELEEMTRAYGGEKTLYPHKAHE